MLDKNGNEMPTSKRKTTKGKPRKKVEKIDMEVVNKDSEEIDGIQDTAKVSEPINYNEHLLQGNGEYQLTIPRTMPGRGRVIAIVFGKREIVTKAGIILPSVSNVENERDENPWSKKDYRVVALHEEVRRELPLKINDVVADQNNGFATYQGKKTKIDIGDYVRVGVEFVPILITEGANTFAIMHYMDIVGVEKAPVMLKGPEDIIEEIQKKEENK